MTNWRMEMVFFGVAGHDDGGSRCGGKSSGRSL